MRLVSWWPAGLAALVAGAALAPHPAAAPTCQTARLLGVRAPLILLATAGADTVRAGPGPIRYTGPDADPASLAGIHGQRFRLDRAGGDVPPELAGAEGGEVVLVPYGWECEDTWRWHEARWTEPGTQRFVDASLRPRGQWVEGRPTFDVEMIHHVYPDGWARWVEEEETRDAMSPAEAFDLQLQLPTYGEVEAAPYPAYRRLLAWARTHPALAARFPAPQVLAEASDALQPCVPPHDPHPVAGTYRASVIVEGRDTLSLTFSTNARGFPECDPAPLRLDLTAVQPRVADTTRLSVNSPPVASTPAGPAPYIRCGGGSVVVLQPPDDGAEGRRAWQADFNYLVFPHCGPAHAALHAAARAVFAEFDASTDAAGSDDDDVPGWFREGPDGAMRFEQAWRAGGRVRLEVRAVRIDHRTLEPG